MFEIKFYPFWFQLIILIAYLLWVFLSFLKDVNMNYYFKVLKGFLAILVYFSLYILLVRTSWPTGVDYSDIKILRKVDFSTYIERLIELFIFSSISYFYAYKIVKKYFIYIKNKSIKLFLRHYLYLNLVTFLFGVIFGRNHFFSSRLALIHFELLNWIGLPGEAFFALLFIALYLPALVFFNFMFIIF